MKAGKYGRVNAATVRICQTVSEIGMVRYEEDTYADTKVST